MIEQKTVQITLGSETREVLIERLSEKHCWHARGVRVICRFRTGHKTHGVSFPQVVERNGAYYFATQVVHNRHVTPVAFETEDRKETSKW